MGLADYLAHSSLYRGKLLAQVGQLQTPAALQLPHHLARRLVRALLPQAAQGAFKHLDFITQLDTRCGVRPSCPLVRPSNPVLAHVHRPYVS